MAVNAQVTDSVTQVNTKVVGDVPAMAMGNLLMASSQSLGNMAHNATDNQQQASIVSQTSTIQGLNSLMSIGSAVTDRSVEEILNNG